MMEPSVKSYTSSRVNPMDGELRHFAVDLEVTEKDEFTDYIGEEMLDTEADSIVETFHLVIIYVYSRIVS